MTELLAERARSGDLARFDELYLRVAPALFGWAALRIGPKLRSRLQPEEIVQETWLRALQGLGRFDAQRGPFRAWIFGLAKNVLLEALRSLDQCGADQGGASGSGMTTRSGFLEDQADTVTSATRRIARDDGLRCFLERVRALGEDEQNLVILCGLEGLSCDQAALRLGLSHEATIKRWQRLRAEIASRGLPPELLGE